jgi:hypothetical protein
MDNKERKLFINQRGTLPGMGTPRPPIVAIEDLEQDLADEEAVEEFETSETLEMPVPAAIHDSDDEEGPTGIFEIRSHRAGVQTYWVQRV